MPTSLRTRLGPIVGVILLVLQGACASSPPGPGSADVTPSARSEIPAGQYPAAFETAKHTLRDIGFLLERVDAQGGVMTTKPLGSAGIASPWDQVETGIDQEFENLGQRQVRIVRIDFVPVGGEDVGPTTDLRTLARPVEARVVVAVNRYYASGLRINSGNIGRSTYAIDTDLESRGMLNYGVAVKEDRRLADRIAHAISEGVSKAQASAAP